jgi:hypothetical protein
MRQNVIIALLAVIATLLLVSVFSPPHYVLGQMASGGNATIGSEVAVATGSLAGGAGSAFYLYDPKEHKLLVYYLANSGLEIRAVRDLEWDMKAVDFNQPQGKMVSVQEMKKAIGKQAGSKPGAKSSKKDAEE